MRMIYALIGAPGAKLRQLLRSGALVRINRGLYATPDRALMDMDQLAQLSIKFPQAELGHSDRYLAYFEGLQVSKIQNNLST